MVARAVEDAACRLRELHHEAWERLGLAALAFGLAIAASQLQQAFAVPLLIGGLALGALGMTALWRHWDLLDRLAGERDAYAIAEVLAYASREATMERRHAFAESIRSPYLLSLDLRARAEAMQPELDALAEELDDEELQLDPASAVRCMRLVSDGLTSPLLNPAVPADELRSRIAQIRSGFRPRAEAPGDAVAGKGRPVGLPNRLAGLLS